jgi:hypothetical protein
MHCIGLVSAHVLDHQWLLSVAEHKGYRAAELKSAKLSLWLVFLFDFAFFLPQRTTHAPGAINAEMRPFPPGELTSR